MTTSGTSGPSAAVGAYIHARPDGSPFYVGKGKFRRARYFGERNPHHKNIVAKHGASALLWGFYECSTDEAAFELEQGLIKRLRAMGINLCNLTAGGDGGHSPEPETRARLSAAAKKRGVSKACREARDASRRGAITSPETKAKLRAAHLGRVFSEEHRKAISEGAKKRGVPQWVRERAHEALRGKPRDAEVVARQAEKMRALRMAGVGTRPVLVDGVYYYSLAAASKATGRAARFIVRAAETGVLMNGRKVEFAK
jgi:hypothetical protein